MLKKIFIFLLLILALTPPLLHAQEDITPIQEYRKANVVNIIEQGEVEVHGFKQPYQKLEVKIIEGSDQDSLLTIEHGKIIKLREDQKVKLGDTVILYKGGFNDQVSDYQIIDKYRLDNILYLAAAFLILVLVVGRLQGLGSIIGLVITFIVIIKFIVPQILAGNDPVVISIIGSSMIILTSIYFSHGFSLKTTTAILSTVITLVVTGLLAAFAIQTSSLTGLGSELAYGLNFNPSLADLNLKGLLLGGIIIGALGVLDDVTTTQASTIFELKKANSTLKFKELVSRGFKVGKDHISAVVNTLVLAYTGASLPILLILILNPSGQPLWLMLNSESITEEIIRTLVGSFGLVLSVPITTLIASWVATRKIK